MPPELTMIWSPCTVNTSPPLSTVTPTAFPDSITNLCAVTLDRTVRFSRFLTGFRYVSAVLIRTPFGLFIGIGPTPPESGLFMSGSSGYPAAIHASRNAVWAGNQVSGLCLLTGIGPSEPWKSSLISVSVSAFRKYGNVLIKDHSSLPQEAQLS